MSANYLGVYAQIRTQQMFTTTNVKVRLGNSSGALGSSPEAHEDGEWFDATSDNNSIIIPTGVDRVNYYARIFVKPTVATGLTEFRATVKLEKNGNPIATRSFVSEGAGGMWVTMDAPGLGVSAGDNLELEIIRENSDIVVDDNVLNIVHCYAISTTASSFKGVCAQVLDSLALTQLATTDIPFGTSTGALLPASPGAGNIAYDVGGFWDSSQRTRFTIPAGVTRININATIRIEADTSAAVSFLRIKKNGTEIKKQKVDVHNGTDLDHSFSILGLEVTEGDYISFAATCQNDDGDIHANTDNAIQIVAV